MSKGEGWDLTSLHSLEGAAEWIRKRSGGLLVLVVRAEDVAFAVDPAIAPSDAVTLVETVMPEAMRRLEETRLEAKARAKVKRFQGLRGEERHERSIHDDRFNGTDRTLAQG